MLPKLQIYAIFKKMLQICGKPSVRVGLLGGGYCIVRLKCCVVSPKGDGHTTQQAMR